MHRRPFFTLIAAAVLVAFSGSTRAVADNILGFSQVGNSNTLTATVNSPTDTQTTLSVSTAVTINQYAGGGTPISATFTLNATSVWAATSVVIGGVTEYSQSFTGTFSFVSGLTNYLIRYVH